MTVTTADVKALESRHVLQTYKRLPVVFERGSGTRLFDEPGRAYLDSDISLSNTASWALSLNAAPGPHDASYFFPQFVRLIEGAQGKTNH